MKTMKAIMKTTKRIYLSVLLAAGCLMFGQTFAEGKDRLSARTELLKSIKSSQILVYSPKTAAKAVVTVFTDFNCGYCVKLHQEIPKLNDLGIELRMMPFPRHGVNSSSYNTMVSVWCSKDPKEALGQAMEGNQIKRRTCKNPVVEDMLIGHKLGVNGTPMLFFEDGTSHSGYLPAERLAKEAIKHSNKGE